MTAQTDPQRARIVELLSAVEQISDAELREAVISVWVQLWRKSAWEDVEDCPFSKGFATGPKYSLVKHTKSVTNNALRMAETLEEDFDVTVDMDRLLAICLLHDVSKLVEHDDVDGVGVKSAVGLTFPHAMLGGVEATRLGIDDIIVKTIVLHPYHPPHTFVKPTCVEHLLQHWADLGTADPLFFLMDQPTHMDQRRLFEVIPG
jgi:putative nucleotidyltransferase with HDIG domain